MAMRGAAVTALAVGSGLGWAIATVALLGWRSEYLLRREAIAIARVAVDLSESRRRAQVAADFAVLYPTTGISDATDKGL